MTADDHGIVSSARGPPAVAGLFWRPLRTSLAREDPVKNRLGKLQPWLIFS